MIFRMVNFYNCLYAHKTRRIDNVCHKLLLYMNIHNIVCHNLMCKMKHIQSRLYWKSDGCI